MRVTYSTISGPPGDEDDAWRRFAAARSQRMLPGGPLQSLNPGSENCSALMWKNRLKTSSAAGAAAVPPCPPSSISAHTTSSGLATGPYPHHHDWLTVVAYF